MRATSTTSRKKAQGKKGYLGQVVWGPTLSAEYRFAMGKSPALTLKKSTAIHQINARINVLNGQVEEINQEINKRVRREEGGKMTGSDWHTFNILENKIERLENLKKALQK